MKELIWRIKHQELYLCTFCVSYSLNQKFKSQLIQTNIKHSFDKCCVCNRYLSGIYHGPDLIELLQSNPQNISKYSVIYYNDIYNNIGHDLINKYHFKHNDVKNIYQYINNLQGLPSVEYINNIIDELYKKM